MRILDVNGNEVQNPDLDLGYLTDEKLFVAHHPAVEYVKEVYHYEDVKVYPDGRRDVKKVIDVPGVSAQDAWDEYEDIQRYTLYTPEEYAARHANDNLPTTESRVSTLETSILDLTNMVSEMMIMIATIQAQQTPTEPVEPIEPSEPEVADPETPSKGEETVAEPETKPETDEAPTEKDPDTADEDAPDVSSDEMV